MLYLYNLRETFLCQDLSHLCVHSLLKTDGLAHGSVRVANEIVSFESDDVLIAHCFPAFRTAPDTKEAGITRLLIFTE